MALSLQHLLALNCDVRQGFLFAKPMAFEPLTHWLAVQQQNAL